MFGFRSSVLTHSFDVVMRTSAAPTAESGIFEKKGSTGQQAGPSDQQLEVEFIRGQVGSWTSEDGMSTLLLQVHDPVLFS